MTLQLTGRHVEITPAIRDFVTQKITKISKHFDSITSTHVILSVENHQTFFAEAKMDISGAQIFAKTSDNNMYAAIDFLIDKLDRQLIKHKEKIKSHSGPKLIIKDEDEDLE